MQRFIFPITLSFALLGLGDGSATPQPTSSAPRRIIIFVWDGLRADDVTPETMPHYFGLARSGVVFADQHTVYPTFTMMNSASIATGTYPGKHGFYGNPDATNHAYGPGTYNSIDATKMNDEILGRVVDKIRELGWEQTTDIIITQDHNHSTVSGDVAHFPLRGVAEGASAGTTRMGTPSLASCERPHC
jgi:predicted AlkP superfamily pyrophosphatase or phosphodiesterase